MRIYFLVGYDKYPTLTRHRRDMMVEPGGGPKNSLPPAAFCVEEYFGIPLFDG
ncbi:MAG TPA: hypothetical protein VIF60_18180 [Burkholderiaceae bacterium]|jgi:hypothetical protein